MKKEMRRKARRGWILTLCAALTVSCGPSVPEYDATGAFEAVEVTVSSEGNGRILAMYVSEGDRLSAGDPIADIDSLQLCLARKQLLQQALSVRTGSPDVSAQLAVLEEQLRKQRTEKERVEKLFARNAATRKQLDDIAAAVMVLEKQLAAQRSVLLRSAGSLDAQGSAIDLQVAQIEDQLAKCHLKAPVSGMVLNRYAEAGEFVAVGRPVLRMADVDRMYLRAYLTSAQLAGVQVGDRIRVYADPGAGLQREYTGRITWISESGEFTPKGILTADERASQVYAVKIAVENDGFIKMGMFGGVVLP